MSTDLETIQSETGSIQPLDIQASDTKTLRAELSRALSITSKYLVYLATIWKELESRGEDMSDLRSGLATYLPLIANDKLDADLVVRYAGQKMLLTSAARMPIDAQRQMAQDGEVTIVRVDESGKRQEVRTQLHKLSSTDIRNAFGEHGLRTPDEQFLLVAKPVHRRSTPKLKYRKARRVMLDAESASVIVSTFSVPIDRIIPLLNEYYGEDIKVPVRR